MRYLDKLLQCEEVEWKVLWIISDLKINTYAESGV